MCGAEDPTTTGATQFRASLAPLARARCAAQWSNALGQGVVPGFPLQSRKQRLFIAQSGRPVGVVMRMLTEQAKAAAFV